MLRSEDEAMESVPLQAAAAAAAAAAAYTPLREFVEDRRKSS